MAPRHEVIPATGLPARLAALGGWRGDTAGITKDYPIGWDNAIQVATAIGKAATELEHRPDLDVRWEGLRVFMTTHTAGDVVTELDLLMAARIDQIVTATGTAKHSA